MKEGVFTRPDEEKDLHSTQGSVDTKEEEDELAHIQLTKGRFLLVLTGMVLAIFLVSKMSFIRISILQTDLSLQASLDFVRINLSFFFRLSLAMPDWKRRPSFQQPFPRLQMSSRVSRISGGTARPSSLRPLRLQRSGDDCTPSFLSSGRISFPSSSSSWVV
jgi:hypothetical protein